MSTVRSLLRNTGLSILANLLNRSANTLLFILISRRLGPVSAGMFGLATSYFFIGSRFAFWGLNHLLTREVAKRREDATLYFSNFAVLRAGLAIAVIAVTAALVNALPYSQASRSVILIVTLAILPENISDICQALFVAFEEVRYLSIVAALGAAVKLALGAFYLQQGANVEAMALIYTGVAALMMVANLAVVALRFTGLVLAFDWGFCRQQLRVAVPFVFIGVFFILDNRLDTVLLSLLGSERMVGYYSAAMTIISALMLIPEGFRTALFPVLARFYARPKSAMAQLYSHSVKYFMLLACPIVAGIMLVGQEGVSLVFGDDFAAAGPVLGTLSWSLGFFFFSVLHSRLLIVADLQHLIARSLLINTVATVLLTALLVPSLGAMGAACARSVTAGILFLQYGLAVRRFWSGLRLGSYVWRPLLATAMMVVAVLIAQHGGLFLRIGIGGVVYLTALIALRTFSVDERNMWLRALAGGRVEADTDYAGT